MDALSDPVEPPLNPRLWALAIGLNCLVLAELCFAMYMAADDPEDFTRTFITTFFGMLVPTLLVTFLVRRHLGKKVKGESGK